MNFCHTAASCLLMYISVAFHTLHYGSTSRGLTRGARGRNSMGAESLWGCWNTAGGTEWWWWRQKVQTISQALSLQYICFRKTSGSNMGALNLILAPSAIYPHYAHINQEISFAQKLIHSLLCCKTTMQTNFGRTNCIGNSPETGFSFSIWRLVNSWVSYKFSILHSYFYCCFSFSFEGGHQALKK